MWEVFRIVGCHCQKGMVPPRRYVGSTDTMQLVNQTLSQSVPASIILAVKSLTKILERAGKVQSQWIEVDDEIQTSKPKSPGSDNE